MYLNRKHVAALVLALEAMESYPAASYNDEQNEAMRTIVDIIDAARREWDQRASKRDLAKLRYQAVKAVARGFNKRD